MGTVLVARGSEILLNKGYGHANLEWEIDFPRGRSTVRAANWIEQGSALPGI
jgi:hypothetical protein